MPPDIADLQHEKWEARNGPPDGLTEFEIEPYRSIEIVGPVMRIRAKSLEGAIEIAECQVEIEAEAAVLEKLLHPDVLSAAAVSKHCFVQEDAIKVRRVE